MADDQPNQTLAGKHDQLRAILQSCERVAVAFSGGVDSTLVLKEAIDVLGPEQVVAMTGRSPSLSQREYADACALAAHVGARHVIIDTTEFEDDNYVSNPHNRCYFCKTTLYRLMADRGAAQGYAILLSGTNSDDLGDWRPGLKAAEEHGVRAPLAEAGLTKQDVRALSLAAGLPTADKPASPCLSSRIPYGQAVTPTKLERIEQGESMLKDLGFTDCRVRHHDDLARIEVPLAEVPRLLSPEVRVAVDARLRELGFLHVTVDLRGLRSGSLNAVLSLPVAR